jgi:8-oxo-dGTP diphosphatase
MPFQLRGAVLRQLRGQGSGVRPPELHRKLTTTKGFVVPSGGTTSRGGRPVRLHRVGAADILRPPLMRPDNPKRGRSR